jgi:uracil-DNA glycosylase
MPERTVSLSRLQSEIVDCRKCPRLCEYCAGVARVKRRAYLDWEYWGKPVPGFGDPNAELLVVGLAPGAHGANRTGRLFTGDRSGDFLFRAMWETGFASQPESTRCDDGLTLRNAFITAVARCAPPDNKPTRQEFANCRPYFETELTLLTKIRVVVALGKIAFDAYLATLRDRGEIRSTAAYRFAHGAEHRTGSGAPLLIASYHPSQQNTSTGRLTAAMLRSVFEQASRHLI